MANKKFCTTILIILLLITNNLFSLNIYKEPLNNPFPSEESLNSFEKTENISFYNQEDLENLKISLITITPGDPIYSWFGHSAILVEQGNNNSIIYDYGIFSFNSDNFLENFMLGKMYYLLLPSEASQRISRSIDENREVKQLILNIPNEKKVDIIKFLNYNSQAENRTYLYDFYLDNCATRIRDIFNWASDGDFKKWALEQESPFSFRILSSKELSRSYFVNWCLNAFLGPSNDIKTSLWENMFLPEYLEKAVRDYEGFKTEEVFIYKTENTSTFNELNINNNKILFYCLFALILSLLGLYFKSIKQKKNSRIYGFYNIIINLFNLIISITITFFVFFSNIMPAYNNENIFFLNPIFSLIFFILSILIVSKKENSFNKLYLYENICKFFSLYLILLIIAKLIFPLSFTQHNLIILLPILIYYSIQGFFKKTIKVKETK